MLHRIEGERIGDEADRAGQPDQQRTVTTNYRLRVLPTFSLLSSVGGENINDPTLSDEPCGYTRGAGFAWQPNSRSSMELTCSVERQTQMIGFDANYALSNRTSIFASYSKQLTSSQELLQEDLGFLVDKGAGVLIDSRTGKIFDVTNQNLDFQTLLFHQ